MGGNADAGRVRNGGTLSLVGRTVRLTRTRRSVRLAIPRPGIVSRHLKGRVAHCDAMSRWASILLAAALAALGLLCTSATASAQQMRCSITNAVGPSFGPYDTLSPSPRDSAGFISFRCERVGPSDMIVIEISRGQGHSFMPRGMSRRGERLEYNLYLDAARTVIWGDGSRGTSRYQVRPSEGRTESVPIYGRIPPRQTVVPGSYSDHVVLTVNY